MYKGQEPFPSFLKKYFAQYKKFGSKDRKQIARLCYSWFRLGRAITSLPFEERLAVALLYTADKPDPVLGLLQPQWNEQVSNSLEEKMKLTGYIVHPEEIFPAYSSISAGIDNERFVYSHFIQPDLFLRIRPGYEGNVKRALEAAAISFEEKQPGCLALPNASKVDELIKLNKEAVVQDYSSQRTGQVIQSVINNPPQRIWDCCAASGGKSIMLHDLFPHASLIVSDIRESIIANLHQRFQQAGIRNYQSFVADIAEPKKPIPLAPVDMVIADLPCSGSGTWGRNPENLVYFDKGKIQQYAALQQRILQQVMKYITPGGYIVYITCSVYKEENEDNVTAFIAHSSFNLLHQQILEGYNDKADSMFIAVMQRS